jgi:DNA-binding sugar fermentation-stimulating protein
MELERGGCVVQPRPLANRSHLVTEEARGRGRWVSSCNQLSKKSWIVAVNTSLSAKVSRNTLKPYNWKELLKLSERIRTRVVEELKKRVDVVSTLPRNSCWLGQLEAMAN